jgi:hypothetical protein
MRSKKKRNAKRLGVKAGVSKVVQGLDEEDRTRCTMSKEERTQMETDPEGKGQVPSSEKFTSNSRWN